jgi:putative tricarboxylic transport membrane protein
MNALENLLHGLGSALTPQNLLWVLIGVTLGTVVGILPGLGNPAAVLAVLLPLTLKLPPTTGLIMMAGLYHGAKFAGSTTAILLKIPTETSSVVLCYDGHQLARQGRAGPAMGMSRLGAGLNRRHVLDREAWRDSESQALSSLQNYCVPAYYRVT